MRGGEYIIVIIGIGAGLVGCELATSDCGDGHREAGVLCFPAEDIVHVGQGFDPGAMAVLDIDGDGALDLAAANPERRTLSITWGGPGPTLERMTSWSVGRTIAGLAYGDFDGDGHLDLATALPEDDAVATLRGRGGRSFELTMYAAGASPRAVLGVDLDADGTAELLTANLGDGSVSVLRRGVAGPPIAVGDGPHALAAGDLDGDGAPDVAVALADEDAVQVLTGGGGALLPGARHIVGFAPRAVVVGDLDGDGAVDLASADELGESVTVVRGDGAGDALETLTWPVMPQPSALAIVRGAGSSPGLGVMSEQTSEVLLLDPRSGAAAPGGSASWAGALAAGDLDGDGSDELVVGGPRSEAAAMVAGEGLRFTADWHAPAVWGFAPVDLDGDGREEYVVVPEPTGDLAVWRGPEDVTGAERLATGLDFVKGFVGADLDADGRADLVAWGGVVGTAGDVIAVLMQQADGSFDVGGPLRELGGVGIGQLRAGDVGGDGTTDLVLSAQPPYNADMVALEGLWLVPGDGAGGLAEPLQIDPRPLATWRVVDLDGDAALDLVAVHGDALSLEIHTDLEIGESPRIVELLSPVWALDAGDVDGDGAVDLLFCTLRGLGLLRDIGGPGALSIDAMDDSCGALELRDVDGDGDLDALAQSSQTRSSALYGASPRREVLTVLTNDGFGGFSVAQRQMFAGAGAPVRLIERGAGGFAVVVAGVERFEVLRAEVGPVLTGRPLAALGDGVLPRFCDLDGDGVVDWFGASSRQVVAAFGAGGGAFGPAHHAALAGLVDEDVVTLGAVALADLDGDGADEAVTLAPIDNPALNLRALTVLRVDRDEGFTGETLARIASTGDVLVVRDLDGDAHPDILVVEGSEEQLRLARFRGRGDGSFDAAVTQQLDGGGYLHGLVELDGDERRDLLLQTSGGLAVARGQSGGFDAPRVLWSGQFFRPIVRDVTGDHRHDLLGASQSGDLLLLPGDGVRFAAPRVIGVASFTTMLEIADLDGDGAEELLIGNGIDGTASVQVGRPVGDGRFAFRGRDVPILGPNLVELQARDLDGDAAPDVVLSTAGGFTIVRQLP